MMATNQTQAKAPRPNGLLSIPASATNKQATARMETLSSRSTAPRPKMIVRRLPPGLSQAEFEASMGKEWQVHQGKVDWIVYKPGKVSTEYITLHLSPELIASNVVFVSLTKPSKPSRAYLHLINPKYVNELVEKVRSTNFTDAMGSARDTALLGPPIVEFDPFGRIPSNKPRKDLRQGTIDQDQEFIDFLESLTNPLPKVTTVDQEGETASKTKEKVVITPLVQYLKDKKANKGKEVSTPSKGPKHTRQDSKDSKSSATAEKKTPVKATTTSPPEKRSAQAIKVENAARDAVKVLNKQATMTKKPPEPSVTPSIAPQTPVNTNSAPLIEKKRERGNASVAARILQRDLGLSAGGRGGRGGRRAAPIASARTESDKTSPPAPASTIAKEPANDAKPTPIVNIPSPSQTPETAASSSTPESSKPTSAQPPTGPSASRNAPKAPLQSRGNGTVSAQARTPNISPTATQAFLKHANPSQGITEPLLEEAFTPFGSVSKVEIDKKKGFAYVDFAEPVGLQNAIKASPIKVAQGQVVVLERKTGSTLQARNMRGGAVGPIRGGQQGMIGNRGGALPAMVTNRGGGPPMGPRAGRGGVRGRGGMNRGAMVGQNLGAMTSPQTAETVPESAITSAETTESPTLVSMSSVSQET